MKITYSQLKDKIKGCFDGKNIGGTLGAPFECLRQINDVNFYVQKDIDKNPPPNDDLDLQIVWLNAVERFGAEVDQKILSEYWLTYIYPRWSEYGTAKANLQKGFNAPVSGRLENFYGESCGCFIRSEIWACLAPAHPEIAACYAYYDASVDHYGEGVYGEVFCAAAESAAFVESDLDKITEIGLSYIPKDCLVAKAVRVARDGYKSGKTFLQTREELFKTVPGSFGLQCKKLEEMTEEEKNAPAGCDAPNNIGIAAIGLYYGEGDFEKTVCIAVNCGEDTDCTAGFAGALLGITLGGKGIPKKWSGVLDGVINTCCIDKSEWGIFVPKTVEEFADRILAAIPAFLKPDFLAVPLVNFSEKDIYSVTASEALFCPPYMEYKKDLWRNRDTKKFDINELKRLPEWCEYAEFPAFKAVLCYEKAPFVLPGEKFSFTLNVINNGLARSQMWADIRVFTTDGLVADIRSFSVPLQNTYRYEAKQSFSVTVAEKTSCTEEVAVEISINGRSSYGVIRSKLAIAGEAKENG